MKHSPYEYSGSFGCPRNRGKFSKGNERKLNRGKGRGLAPEKMENRR